MIKRTQRKPWWHIWPCGAIGVLFLLAACRDMPSDEKKASAPPLVRVAQVEAAKVRDWQLVGTVRARYETVLSFRLAGEIRRRAVQAGERVAAGQTLFELDDRDMRQGVQAAEAQAAAALAEMDNAERERRRAAALREQHIVSEQAYELAVTLATAARERWRAATAALEVARSQLAYTHLSAPAPGVVAEVFAEVGQVVAPGQAVAVLALDGPREVEVFLPETRQPEAPQEGKATIVGSERQFVAKLREVAAGAEPLTRTWRARYALEGDTSDLPLGGSVQLHFADTAGTLRRVPAGAVFENGDGPQVWVVRDGHVELTPVRVEFIDGEYAFLSNDLPVGTQVVALGVHMLVPGQAVRIAP